MEHRREPANDNVADMVVVQRGEDWLEEGHVAIIARSAARGCFYAEAASRLARRPATARPLQSLPAERPSAHPWGAAGCSAVSEIGNPLRIDTQSIHQPSYCSLMAKP